MISEQEIEEPVAPEEDVLENDEESSEDDSEDGREDVGQPEE